MSLPTALLLGALHVPFEFPAERYAQEFEVVFKTERAAGKASLRMLPLYDGYQWAISSRWDDNNRSDLKMHRVLAEHGYKATWYLNAPIRWRRDFTDTGRELLKGANSIGGHSLTHPMRAYTSRNRIFEEVAGIRMEWEAAADTLVVSYAFSFCNFRNALESEAVQADITRALERAGYYNIANGWYHDRMRTDMILSPIMPSDGKEIDGYAESALRSGSFREKHPNLSFSMHVWYKTPEAWAKFERQLDKYGRNPDWWYCNQNQYAAYRYQYLHSDLQGPARGGKVLRATLLRPALVDLNDPIPLTFEVRGVPAGDIAAVRCRSAECAPAGRRGGAFRFHLHHDRNQALPGRIGLVQNRDNRRVLEAGDIDPDFPDLRVLLHFADGGPRLALDNRGDEPLSEVRITYRLPLAWKEGVVRRAVGTVAAGSLYQDELGPTRLTNDYKYNSGFSFFVAQVDFLRGRERGRLYASCRVREDRGVRLDDRLNDRAYPQGGFLRLGPIPEDRIDLKTISSAISTQPWELEWQADDSPFEPPFLDPEIIRVTGKWGGKTPCYYLLQGSILSDVEQSAEFRFPRQSVRRLFLNGEDATEGPAQLRKGANKLIIVYHCGGGRRRYRGEHAGCFLRAVKPGTQERLTGIRFEPPGLRR